VTKKVDFIMLTIILSLLTVSLISGCGGGDSNITGISSSQSDKSIITGTVYDENGTSIGEIPVFLKSVGDYEMVIKNTVTGTEGTFSFIITSEGSYYLEAKNEESVYYSYEFQVKLGANQNVPVGYTPGPEGPTGPTGPPGVTGPAGSTGAIGNVVMGSIRINAQDNRGNAVTNAEIVLKREAFTGSESSLSASDATGTGWYLFENLEYGRYIAEINASVYPPQNYSILLNTSNVTGNLLVGWENNLRVDDVLNSNVMGPAIAVQSSIYYAIWEDSRNGNSDIYSSYRPAGGSWQSNVRVDDAPGVTGTANPAIAVDSTGNAYAIWCDTRNGNQDIYFSYRPAGGSWQANVRVDDAPGATDIWYPTIAVDSSENAYAVWTDDRNGGTYDDIYFSYRPSGSSWQANVRVDDAPAGSAYEPDIAVDASGNSYALWSDNRSGNRDIYYSFRPSGGNWQANSRIDDGGGTNAFEPEIGVDSNCNAYAIWHDERNGNTDIYYSYCPYGSFWHANVRVDDATGSSNAMQVSLAVEPLNNSLYAVWRDFRLGATANLYFSELDCFGPFF